jgi:hypothetical protein
MEWNPPPPIRLIGIAARRIIRRLENVPAPLMVAPPPDRSDPWKIDMDVIAAEGARP